MHLLKYYSNKINGAKYYDDNDSDYDNKDNSDDDDDR